MTLIPVQGATKTENSHSAPSWSFSQVLAVTNYVQGHYHEETLVATYMAAVSAILMHLHNFILLCKRLTITIFKYSYLSTFCCLAKSPTLWS